MAKVNLNEGFASFSEHWRPKVAARLNGQEVRLAKIRGAFPWHQHDDADEAFLCWKGIFRLEFEDRVVPMSVGDLIVVPRGIRHRPVADEEAEILLFEPSHVVNTGEVKDDMFTAPLGVALAPSSPSAE